MSYGPNPWQQTSWDWRAAGNFIGGGAGSGLLIVGSLLGGHGAALGQWPVWAGLVCVGLGLLCVWLEIGRPLRALHVFFNPRTSWMSREAFVAALLFPTGLLTLLGFPWARLPLALLAVAFLYCQARMLPATKGIPAWRPRMLTPFMLATGLVEGSGLWLVIASLTSERPVAATALFVALVLARQGMWWMYRGAVDAQLAPRARRALDDGARILLYLGTVGAVAAAVLALLVPPTVAAAVLAACAGMAALVAGAMVKYTVITRAAFNQGFTLTHIPVRGVRAPT